MTMDFSNAEAIFITSPDDPNLKEAHDCYLRSFTLEEEQIKLGAFQDVLKNDSEAWLCLRDKTTGKVFAGANFSVFAGNKAKGIDGTCHETFTFVDKEYRRQGVFSFMADQCDKFADKLITEKTGVKNPKKLWFVEQNATLLVSPEQYATDSDVGIDQNLRRTIYERKKGYREMLFRYIQPDTGSGVVDYLALAVRGAPEGGVPVEALEEHLDRWFADSFPPGTSRKAKSLRPMEKSLAKFKNIPTLPAGVYETLNQVLGRQQVDELLEKGGDQIAMRLGEIFPQIAIRFYGAEYMSHFKDVLPGAAKRAEGMETRRKQRRRNEEKAKLSDPSAHAHKASGGERPRASSRPGQSGPRF